MIMIYTVLVDSRSSVEVLLYDAILKMNIFPEWLEKLDTLIIGFSGEPILVKGTITLSMIAESASWRSQV